VPPKPIRTLRNLTRYRKAQIKDRQREAGRLHKILEDTGIKLRCVASDLLGKSGRAMLEALIEAPPTPRRWLTLRGDFCAGARAQRSAPGPLRQRARDHRRADPRAHRLPGRVDRRALHRDRGADRPVRQGG
jgi:hypothetical protein